MPWTAKTCCRDLAVRSHQFSSQPPQRGAASATVAAGTGLRLFCARTALNAASADPLIPVHLVTAFARSLHPAAYAACIASVGARSPVSSALAAVTTAAGSEDAVSAATTPRAAATC